MNKIINKHAKTGIVIIIGTLSGIGALVTAQFAENNKATSAKAGKIDKNSATK